MVALGAVSSLYSGGSYIETYDRSAYGGMSHLIKVCNCYEYVVC